MNKTNTFEELTNFAKLGESFISEAQKCEEKGDNRRAIFMAILAKIYYESVRVMLNNIIEKGMKQ